VVYCLLFLPVLTAFLLKISKTEKLYVIPFIMLFIFASVRYGFGNDYFSYQNMYNSIQNGYRGSTEYLYVLLNITMPNFYLLVAVTSLVFILSVYLLIKNNVAPQYVCFSVFIFVINTFCFLINLSAIRQCLAMNVFIFAIQFAKKKKFLCYLIMILIAMLFHNSAVLLLPFYFIANDTPINKGTVLIIIVVIAITLSGNIIPFIADFMAKDIFDNADYIHYVSGGVTNSVRATILSSMFLIYTILNLTRLEGNALVYAKLYLVGAVFSVFAIKLSMLTRLQMYFDIFSVVALPMIFKQTFESDAIVYRDNVIFSFWNVLNKYAFPILLMIIFCLRYYSFFTNPLWKSFTEYKTIFSFL